MKRSVAAIIYWLFKIFEVLFVLTLAILVSALLYPVVGWYFILFPVVVVTMFIIERANKSKGFSDNEKRR